MLGLQVAEPRGWRVAEALAGTTGTGALGTLLQVRTVLWGAPCFHTTLTEVAAPGPRPILRLWCQGSC